MRTETAASSATSPKDVQPEPRDLDMLRAVFRLAEESRADGRHPFAAIIVDEAGTIVVEAFNNSRPPEGNPTQHAELRAAAMASGKLSPAELAKCTLYTNAEPCCMCAGAIYWCGIGRVVYGLSEENLLAITGSHPENPTLSLPCREVFAAGQREIVAIGPLLEDEAAKAHEGFWK